MSEKSTAPTKLNSARETSNRVDNETQPNRAQSARLSNDSVAEKLEKVEIESTQQNCEIVTVNEHKIENDNTDGEKNINPEQMKLNLEQLEDEVEANSGSSDLEANEEGKTLTNRSKKKSTRSVKNDQLSSRSNGGKNTQRKDDQLSSRNNKIDSNEENQAKSTARKEEHLSARSNKNEEIKDVKSGRNSFRKEDSNLERSLTERKDANSNQQEARQLSAR